jgi:serine/threonine-protein kinase
MRKPANGTGVPEVVLASDSNNVGPSDFSSDGKTLFYCVDAAAGNVMSYELEGGDSTKRALCATPFNEIKPSLSPDGKYLAYTSDESGEREVYVRELSASGGKWQISTSGGNRPLWSADGHELFYADRDWDFMAVPVDTRNGFEAGIPKLLFNRRYTVSGLAQNRYDVSRDGQRFLVNVATVEQSTAFNVVLNWPTELEMR